MVLFFTRFTDEIFSLLISVIFIMEATKDITGATHFVKSKHNTPYDNLPLYSLRDLSKQGTEPAPPHTDGRVENFDIQR